MRDNTEDFDILNEVVHRTPPLVSTRRPDVPKDVDAIVAKLLARAPEDRFQTAEELLQAIDKTAVQQGVLLSSSALARFMRETCGQRSEPWIAMKEQHAHTETITVAGEAIPDRLDTMLDDMMDSVLARLPDLRRSSSVSPVEPTTAPVADSLAPDRSAIAHDGWVWKARAWWFAALSAGALAGLVTALVLARCSGRSDAVAEPSPSDAASRATAQVAPVLPPADAGEPTPVVLVAIDAGTSPVEAAAAKPTADRPRTKPHASKSEHEPQPVAKPAKPDCTRDPLACWR